MDICYVDESGSAELLCASRPTSTPVFVIAGLIVPETNQKSMVWKYLKIKQKYNPRLSDVALSDVIGYEIKGSDLRHDIRDGSRRPSRRALNIIDEVISLIEDHDCKIVARVWVKVVDTPVIDRPVYSSSIRWICSAFHAYLESRESKGLVVLDSRTKSKNTPNTNVITTQRYRSGGDPFGRFVEVPVFGHSDSHVALQVADILASGLLFPLACLAYCEDLSWNQHPHPAYEVVLQRFGHRLRGLQHRYTDEAGIWKGGVYSTRDAKGLPPLFTRPSVATAPTKLLAPTTTIGIPATVKGTNFASRGHPCE